MRDDLYYRFSLLHFFISLLKGWENVFFFSLGVKGLNVFESLTASAHPRKAVRSRVCGPESDAPQQRVPGVHAAANQHVEPGHKSHALTSRHKVSAVWMTLNSLNIMLYRAFGSPTEYFPKSSEHIRSLTRTNQGNLLRKL